MRVPLSRPAGAVGRSRKREIARTAALLGRVDKNGECTANTAPVPPYLDYRLSTAPPPARGEGCGNLMFAAASAKLSVPPFALCVWGEGQGALERGRSKERESEKKEMGRNFHDP